MTVLSLDPAWRIGSGQVLLSLPEVNDVIVTVLWILYREWASAYSKGEVIGTHVSPVRTALYGF